MKKLGIVVVVSLSMLLTACGKSDAVKNVEAEIRSLETISIDSGADIEKAEADYTALTDEEKKQVENIEALEAAKEEFREIRQIADLEEKVTGALDGCTW